MRVTNIRLPNEVLTDIDKLAEKHGINRSEVVRQALTVYLHLVENVGTMLRPAAFRIKPVQITYLRRGDVSILNIPTGHSIVVGSTSSGSIGAKPMDKLKVDNSVLGKFLARAALMDVIATGAFPIMISVTLGVEEDPTGTDILEGVRNEARIIGLDPNQAVMENTEENFEVAQTGAGLTVVGFANEDELRLGKTKPGDLVVAIGKPKVGAEVLPAEARGEIVDLKNVIILAQQKFIHDIAPVGTYGIAHEARMMAYSVGRQIKLIEPEPLDMDKSAGPATVALVSLNSEKLEELELLIRKPVAKIAMIL